MGKRKGKGTSLLNGPGGILAQPRRVRATARQAAQPAHGRGERRGDGAVGAGPHASEEGETTLGGW
jgi:hypothetical protein